MRLWRGHASLIGQRDGRYQQFCIAFRTTSLLPGVRIRHADRRRAIGAVEFNRHDTRLQNSEKSDSLGIHSGDISLRGKTDCESSTFSDFTLTHDLGMMRFHNTTNGW